MGKIRVKTLGDEAQEKEQQLEAKKRREAKRAQKAAEKGEKASSETTPAAEDTGLSAEFAASLSGEQVAQAGEEAPKAEKKTKKVKIRVRSKRYQALIGQVDKTLNYPLKKAVELVKKTSTTKFDGTVEMHININALTLDKDKKSLNGSVNLPNGTGKKRIIVVADDALIERVQAGKIDFDVLVAHPSMMPKLAKVARTLGPKGLMPNPKNGTVSPEPEKRAKELEGGEVNWKTEPDQPVIHQAVGKVSFTEKKLEENIKAMIKAVGSGKIAKITLSSSMGPGIKVDLSSL